MFRKRIIVQSLALAFATMAGQVAVVLPAFAQSNATGTVYGTAPAGTESVVLENVATNAKRTASPEANGKFTVTSLPPGRYRISLLKGGVTGASTEVEVLLGQGVEANFASGSTLQAVQVVGSRQVIDVTSTNSSTTFTARELAALPIAQTLTSIMLLAPDVVKADPRYAGGASIGGGAPSENAYYINGFPVTNPLSQLGSIELPFGAIQQAQIMTGGYGAEFGRSTGGVVNITTKSGGNKWEGGVNFYIEPNNLSSQPRNIYYPSTGANPATDGKLYRFRNDNTRTQTQIGGYVGGPIIQDKLFFFFAADQTLTLQNQVSSTFGAVTSSTLPSNGWIESKDKNQRYLGKVDFNITDSHRLEFTTLGDNFYTDTAAYGFNYSTQSKQQSVKPYTANYKNESNLTAGVGGSANVLKYTGNITPDLVVTALYGQSTSPHREIFTPDIGTAIPGSIFTTPTGRNPNINYGVANPLSGTNLDPPFAKDTTKSGRLDVEYTLGRHTLRAGIDENKLKSTNAGQTAAGGSTYSYRFTTTPGSSRVLGPYTYIIADGSALGNAGYYVRQRVFSSVTNARSDQSAQYLEDRFQVSKDILVTAGLRNESFTGYNGEDQKYIDSKNFLSPRLGVAWDTLGDSSLKVFGNVGRYSIQTPTHVAVRGAGVSTLTDQFFTYTGVDANGVPTGLKPLTPLPVSPDGETGQPKDPNAVAAKDLKPSYQDELILGLEKSLSRNLTVGTKLTYRKLRATLDDSCDPRPFLKYARDHNIDTTYFLDNIDSFSCKSINAGASNNFLVDYVGNKSYTPVTLSAADMGLDKPKRTYLALDIFLEHPFTNGWYGKIAYTWSKNKGNTEGQTKSDNAQTDVAATQTWDHGELMVGSYGYLPSDRRHQIKALGLYQLTPEWMIGGNLAAASGRPKNCSGNYPAALQTDELGVAGSYGAAYFYCNEVLTPRSSLGRLPWDVSLDVNVAYQPAFAKGLKLRVDVFNLFNRQSALAISETREADFDSTSVLPTYQRVISYSAPRTVRFSAQYDF